MSERPASVLVTVIGDCLLDVDVEGSIERLSPDAPAPVLDQANETVRPGGAGLAATLLAREGVRTTLVTGMSDDEAGRRLSSMLRENGVEVVDLGLDTPTPEKVRVRANGHSIVRIDRGGTESVMGDLNEAAWAALEKADVILVSDYGRGTTSAADVRAALASLAPVKHIVWDPHPRGGSPVAGVTMVTPNRKEAALGAGMTKVSSVDEVASAAMQLCEKWQCKSVCVTMDSQGALLQRAGRSSPFVVPALPFVAPDACGAGDRFAGAIAQSLAAGAPLFEAVNEAVMVASAFVGAGGASGWSNAQVADSVAPQSGNVSDVIARVRAAHGTVVATGGCFDLLHAGHVQLLRAARQLGDCLIVLLNSDESVRRLKGLSRPLVHAEDRMAVLRELASVDAVVVFNEDTPQKALERIKPDVFVKGGDYENREIPEMQTLAKWGGTCAVVPFRNGFSTTELIKEVIKREVK